MDFFETLKALLIILLVGGILISFSIVVIECIFAVFMMFWTRIFKGLFK